MDHPQVFRASTIALLFTVSWSLTTRGEDLPIDARHDLIRTFNAAGVFAALQSEMSLPADKVLRDAVAAAYAAPLCAWISGDDGDGKGRNYLEAGLSTGFLLRKHSRYPLIVTVPINMAIGDEQYLFGQRFGYISAGVNVRVPLVFLPSRYGKWTAGSSADLCYYGTTAAEFVHAVGPQLPKLAAVFTVEL